MRKANIVLAVFVALPLWAYADHDKPIELDEIEVTAAPLDSRITNHPAAVETYSRKQIQETVNATTAQQTLKYLPSFQVRERYIGDRNGPIATRTTGTLSSAQTLLYADGVLLSNLLGNSFSFPPRWGLVSPEEIESVSILYGPFSGLYAGNSMGGVINLNTRMPSKFESHASVQSFAQRFKLYGTDSTFTGNHETASVGNKINDFSFWIGVDRLENQSQPMQFANAVSTGTAAGVRTGVTGAFRDTDPQGRNRVTFGSTGLDDSTQLTTKIKLAYDITPTLKAAYTVGVWDLDSRVDVKSYVRDAAGNAIYNGRVSANGVNYDVSGFTPGRGSAMHVMQAFDLKSNTKGFFDWQVTLSDYDYQKDKTNNSFLTQNGNIATTAGNPYINRAGRLTDLEGTGWTVLETRGILRPEHHHIEFGYHIDDYELRSKTNDTADWSNSAKGALFGSSRGQTQTQALYVQDKWQIDPHWALTLGGRAEYWQADNGRNQAIVGGSLRTANYDAKSETKFSPKISLSFEPQPEWGFRASVGKAYRFPTVSELYQQLSQGSTLIENNPNLKTEQVISGEFSAERRFANGLIRASLFHETKLDALVSQTAINGAAIPFGTGTCTATAGCSFIQNVDHVRTNGIELSSVWENALIDGLDLLANATLTDAEILRNDLAPATQGNKPLRIPKQQYKLAATYHQTQNLTYSLGARYSGRQYNTLDNSDNNPDTFGGTSKFFFVDVKVNYKLADRFTASVGVDNLNNYKAYVFHPYPQRTGYVQLKFDY